MINVRDMGRSKSVPARGRVISLSILENHTSVCYIVAQGEADDQHRSPGIDERVKEEAATVLAAIGLTVSDAFRLMMIRIAKGKALPFEPLIPNAETIEAMKAARRGELTTVKTIDELFERLNADD